jgi:transposase
MFVEMDLGDKWNLFCVLDSAGDVVQEGRVRCTQAGLRRIFESMEPGVVAIEAGTHSLWISRLLTELGHSVLVGNPRKPRMIYTNERKSDERDAEMLARIARMDPALLSPIIHRGKEAQAALAQIKSRNCLVEVRTKLINHVRCLVKSFGGRLPTCSVQAFHEKAADFVPQELQAAVQPCLQMVGALTARIRIYDKGITALCERQYPETELLQSIHGVGPLTALTYVLTLEEPGRFARSRSVATYLGLVPRTDQSGDADPQLRITKAGNCYLRQLLVSAAQHILGPFGEDSTLRRWGLRLMERGGKNAKKRAVVTVARKLAVLMHRLWANGEFYEAFPDDRREVA